MTPQAEQLVNAIIGECVEAEECALALELLIERERVNRPVPGDDGGIATTLEPALVRLRLADSEITEIVDSLLAYLRRTPSAPASAVWPVIRCYEARIAPELIGLLKTAATDPTRQGFASACLYGIITSGVGSEWDSQSWDAIRFAAEHGAGQIRAEAANYLNMFDSYDR